jgi:SAM-dependent methyltransferase
VSFRDRNTLGANARGLLRQGLRRAPTRVQDLLRAGCSRLSHALDANENLSTDESGPRVWQSPPVPVPDGLTLDVLESMFRTFSVKDAPPGHLDVYLDDSFWRFCHTWSLVREETGRCLELGANPYFTTRLLEDYTALDLTLVNYYGYDGETSETVSYLAPTATERVEREYKTVMFNVEEDVFPFDTGSFDVVLFCELLEHLLMNPVAVLGEIRRVLKPGGTLVLTTPNVARIDNAAAMVVGRNIYDPYSGFGPYGRHNREFTRHELHHLLEFTGFEVEHSFTADGHPQDPARMDRYREVSPLLEFRFPDLGHYVFVRARSAGDPQAGLPSFLYRDWPEGTIVDFD